MSIYNRGRARQSLIDTLSFRALSQIATILGYVVMVRGMSKEDFGVLNLLYAFIPAVSTFASLGLEQTLRRYQPEYLRAGNHAAAQWLVRFVGSARFGTNVVLLATILLAWNSAAPIFKLTPYRGEFAIFCLLILIQFQVRILQLSFSARMLHRLSVGSVAAVSIVKLIAYSSLAWADALTLDRVVVADVLAFGLVYAMLALTYRRHTSSTSIVQKYRPDATERRRLLRYAFFNNFNDAGTFMLNTKSDNFFIAAFIDPIAVGAYAFYNRLDDMIQHILPVRLFDNVLQPLIFSLSREDAEKRMARYFSLLLNMNLMLQLPALAYAIAFHEELVLAIFGTKFADDSWLLPLIAGFSTINVIAIPATLVAQYEEKAGIILLSKVFAIYNVIALLVLLPIIGIFGAAIASGSAQVLKSAFIWWHVRDLARWTNAGGALGWGLAVWGSVVAVCYLLKHAGSAHQITSLAVGLAVVSVGLLVHVRGPAVSGSDRAILANVLRGREARLLTLIGVLPRKNSDAGPST